jgi:hypothetical protein
VSSETGQVLRGLWRFTEVHPEWEDESDGWQPEVTWWAVRTDAGIVLIDPLVSDWETLDALVAGHGGCAAVVRMLYWHQRSVAEAAHRYGAEVWARPAPSETPARALDRPVRTGQTLPGGLVAYDVARADEIAVWLPSQAALVFGDLLIRHPDGELTLCPDHWIDRFGGAERMRAVLRSLPELGLEHVLVSHGPLVLGDGPAALHRVISEPDDRRPGDRAC